MGSFRRAQHAHRGFTLIEMLVSLAIVTLIALVVLTSHSSFSNSLIVSNTAYDVALSLRSAQSYGLGSRGLGTSVDTGYGLDFSAATPLSYIFFADTFPPASPGCTTPNCKPGDNAYTPNGAQHDSLISTYTINNGISFAGFCAYAGAQNYCTGGVGNPIDELDIVFTRPNTSAQFTVLKNQASIATSPALQSACIALVSPGGTKRYVSVSSVGEIDLPPSCTGL